MPKQPDKIIMTAKIKFPLEIYGFTAFVLFVAFIVTQKIMFGNGYEPIEILSLTVLISACLAFSIYLGRQQYKRLVIYPERIVIKPIYSFGTTIIEKDQLRGFELFETAVRGGLGYNMRLITSDGKRIILPRDNYQNYDKLIAALHKSEFSYLGQTDLNKRFASSYGKLLRWTAIVVPFVLGIFILLKMMKR